MFVQVINIVIKTVVAINAQGGGYASKTNRTAVTFWGVFLHAYLNSGFSQLIANMDTTGTPLEILEFIPKKGTYRDMSSGWFQTVGPQLFTTSIILALNPVIDALILYCLRQKRILSDKGCGN